MIAASSRTQICDGAGRPPKLGTHYATACADRGECRECGGEYQVTKRGTIRAHRESESIVCQLPQRNA